VFGTVILFPLALFIIGRWTATGYSYAGLLKPLAGVALAAVILGEPVRLPFVVGALVVLLGVWLGAFRTGSLSSRSSAVVLPPTPTLEPAFADDRPR
jgi:drug/metabolite transporter (DMT)-like permease